MTLATQPQRDLMEKINVPFEEGITMEDASKKIEAKLGKKKQKNSILPARAGMNGSIIRMNVLNRAVDMACKKLISIDKIELCAERFETWVKNESNIPSS